MNPYAVCDKCKHVFEPQLRDTGKKMFFTCPECDEVYVVLDYSDLIVQCNWCGKDIREVDALEQMGKHYCSWVCYDGEGEWFKTNGEIRE